MEYHIPDPITGKIIFLDGLARSGKGLLSLIIPSLEKVEKINVCEFFDMQIIPAMAMGLDKNFARALVRCQFNELAYNTFISRNVNFRYQDISSVYNHSTPSEYFRRLDCGEDTVMERLAQKWFFPFKTHDLLANRESLDELDLDYTIVELIRDPVDMCYSWYKRGWGHRWGTDPRSFAIKYKGNVVPCYMKGREEEWLDMDEKERSICIPLTQMEKCIAQYKRNPDRTIVVAFEKLIENPDDQISRICSFLGTGRTDYTDYVVENAICGRKKPEPSAPKLEEYKGVRKKYFDMLVSMAERYKDHYGMCRKVE